MIGLIRRGGVVAIALCAAGLAASQYAAVICEGCLDFAAPAAYGTGTHPVSVAVADFDGDGRRDLATANTLGNNVSILLGNGDGTFAPASQYAAGTLPSSGRNRDVVGRRIGHAGTHRPVAVQHQQRRVVERHRRGQRDELLVRRRGG